MSRPVTPRCSRPAASSRGISPADTSTRPTPSTPLTEPEYSRPPPASESVTAALSRDQSKVFSMSRPFEGTPSFSCHRPPPPRVSGRKCRTDHAADRGRRLRPASARSERVVAAPGGGRRQVGTVGAEKAEDEAVVILERRAPVGWPRNSSVSISMPCHGEAFMTPGEAGRGRA